MESSRKDLFLALAMIAGGVVAFFVIIALMGIDPNEQPLGLLDWMLGGVLIAPGFFYLLKWRKMKDAARLARTRQADP